MKLHIFERERKLGKLEGGRIDRNLRGLTLFPPTPLLRTTQSELTLPEIYNAPSSFSSSSFTCKKREIFFLGKEDVSHSFHSFPETDF